MIVPRIASLVAGLLLTAPVGLFAQQETPVAPGDRVRVTAPTAVSGRFVGTVMEISADTCVLAVEGRAEPLTLPLASVTKLEVSRSRRSHYGKGALTGLAVGAAAGAILGAVTFSGSCLLESQPCPVAGAAVGAVGLGLAGALVGAAVVGVTETDRWETVPLDRIRVSLTPDGLRVSASIVF